MIRPHPHHLPTAATLAPGLTPDSARLSRSPPSTPSPLLFPIVVVTPLTIKVS